jgi:hypothetical protein
LLSTGPRANCRSNRRLRHSSREAVQPSRVALARTDERSESVVDRDVRVLSKCDHSQA